MNAVHVIHNNLQILAEALAFGEVLREQRGAHGKGPRVDLVDEVDTCGAVDAAGDHHGFVDLLAVSTRQTSAVLMPEGQKVNAGNALGQQPLGVVDDLLKTSFQNAGASVNGAAEGQEADLLGGQILEYGLVVHRTHQIIKAHFHGELGSGHAFLFGIGDNLKESCLPGSLHCADPRVAVFADFEKGIREEYAEHASDEYANIELVDEFYYGYDLPDESTQEANAMFKNYPDVDVVICPTTVSILATAKIIQDNNMDVKVTGIGLPSEMVSYFDNGICPEMWLWDIYEYGYLTAYTLTALANGTITGAVGDSFDAGKLGTFSVEAHADGGTMVMLSDGLLFDSTNIQEWKDKL